MVATLLACGTICSHAATGVDPRLKTFAALKRQQMEELAAKLHLDVPAEAREFFKAAETGDWSAVSNRFEGVFLRAGPSKMSLPVPGLRNALYVPIHETWGAYATFRDWDGTMLQKFADGVLGSLPASSVYFGGTPAGRFIITTVRDVAKSPEVFVATPKFVMTPLHPPWIYNVTQNAVADSVYMDYLRLVHGAEMWVPSATDMQNAFQEYVSNVQERQQRGERFSPDEQVDSSGHVHGAVGVMNINSIVTKLIFDHNKEKHPFFVEESYVIPWMYPYLEPHGLILKLNKEPLTAIDPAVVTQDRQYWDALTKELLADRHFTGNAAARRTFSKLRSAIGGLYAYRRMTTESEAAFKQAVQLCPTSPEGNFRLAQLYMELGRTDEAIAVLAQLQKLDPLNDKISMAIEQLRKLKRPAEGKQAQ
jgi:hypothetical protein